MFACTKTQGYLYISFIVRKSQIDVAIVPLTFKVHEDIEPDLTEYMWIISITELMTGLVYIEYSSLRPARPCLGFPVRINLNVTWILRLQNRTLPHCVTVRTGYIL